MKPSLSRRRFVALGLVGASSSVLGAACSDSDSTQAPSGLGGGGAGGGLGGGGAGGGVADSGCFGSEALFSEVDDILGTAISSGAVDGVGLMLCDPQGVCYQRSFGADTEGTTHLLGSATKLVSTTAVMTLIDDGSLSLDDTIAMHLPQFGPLRGAITIRQLFNQTHGLPFTHDAIPNPGQDNGLTLEQAVDQIALDDRLTAPAGSLHHYKPAVAYHIAGRIAEVVTGKLWAELFAERVGDPLKMTTFDYGQTLNPRIGGGASSAVSDYAGLLRMHLSDGVVDGTRVLSANAVTEMQKDQLGSTPFTPSNWGDNVGYGLSWWFDTVEDASATPLLPKRMSVPGFYGAVPWIDRIHGYGGFLLVDDGLEASYPIYLALASAIEARLASG